jgi:hypothetical protein
MWVHPLAGEGGDTSELPCGGPAALLLPHQRASLRRMMRMERVCNAMQVPVTTVPSCAPPGECLEASMRMGILADKPGSGKSYTVMCMA